MLNRSGMSWSYDEEQRPRELENLISNFTEQLWKDGFLTNLLGIFWKNFAFLLILQFRGLL